MSLPNETVGAGGVAFTTATCVKAWIEYPFNEQGDSVTKVYHHVMQVKRANYAPLAYDDTMTTATDKPTRSPFPDDALAYWVGDSEPSQIGGDLVEFDRMFANVPADRTDPNGLYPFQFPGNSVSSESVVGDSTGNYSNAIVSALGEPYEVDIVFDMATADAAKLSVGDLIVLNNKTDQFEIDADDGSAPFVPSFLSNNASQTVKIKSISGDTITVNYILAIRLTGTTPTFTKALNATFTSYEVRLQAIPVRDPIQESSASTVVVTYEKATLATDVDGLAKKFTVRDGSAGSIVDTLSASTVPTNLEYTKLITSELYINSENESFERWRGNIYERRLIKVVAQ